MVLFSCEMMCSYAHLEVSRNVDTTSLLSHRNDNFMEIIIEKLFLRLNIEEAKIKNIVEQFLFFFLIQRI